jgi:hypothetical protein
LGWQDLAPQSRPARSAWALPWRSQRPDGASQRWSNQHTQALLHFITMDNKHLSSLAATIFKFVFDQCIHKEFF